MNLQTFASVLLVYRSNFHVMHFNASGPLFDTIHSKTADYYEKCLDDADLVTECGMRLGFAPVNYIEAYNALAEYHDHQFKIIDSGIKYNWDSFVENSAIMFGDILACIESLLDSEEIQAKNNVGIKSMLEGMHNEYDLQYRFINANRVEHQDAGETQEEAEETEDED